MFNFLRRKKVTRGQLLPRVPRGMDVTVTQTKTQNGTKIVIEIQKRA